MRLLSLLLCITLIVFLYIIDIKRQKGISPALWVPLLWMLLLYSRSISEWLNPGVSIELVSSTSMDEGNALDRNITILFMVVGLLILLTRKITWKEIIQNNGWIFWLYYYCLISVLWSDQPIISIKRWIRDMGNIIMVLVVLTDQQPQDAFKTLMRRCFYILIPLSIVFIRWYSEFGRYWGPFGGEPLYVGVSTGKNGLGQICLVGGFFFLWETFERFKKGVSGRDRLYFYINIFYIVMIAYLFYMANSQTSLMTFLIGIVLIMALSTIKRQRKFISIFVIHFALILIVIQMTNIVEVVIKSLGRDVTISGRTELWTHLLEMDYNPLIGTGYRSFWSGDRLSALWVDYWWHPKQAHSGYLETYLNLGIIGLFSLLALLFSTYIKSKQKLMTNFEIGKLQMAILFMLLIYNYTEASFIISTPLWFFFLLSTINAHQSRGILDQ